jgi:hypothetical protein
MLKRKFVFAGRSHTRSHLSAILDILDINSEDVRKILERMYIGLGGISYSDEDCILSTCNITFMYDMVIPVININLLACNTFVFYDLLVMCLG